MAITEKTVSGLASSSTSYQNFQPAADKLWHFFQARFIGNLANGSLSVDIGGTSAGGNGILSFSEMWDTTPGSTATAVSGARSFEGPPVATNSLYFKVQISNTGDHVAWVFYGVEVDI